MRRFIGLLIAPIPLVVLLGLAGAGVATAGGGCHAVTDPIASEGRSTVVKIDGCTFAPTITRVPVGAEIKFVNASFSIHDITGRNWDWGKAQLDVGESFAHRFAAPGIYPYSCSLHPGMAGVVVVGSPALSLASDVQAAPVEPAAPAEPAAASAPPPIAPVAAVADATLPIVAACGFGLLAGALVSGGIVSRRRRPG